MNIKARNLWQQRQESGWTPLTPDRCVTVSETARALAEDRETGCDRRSALTTFIMHWNSTTLEGKEHMLKDGCLDRSGIHIDDLASLAVVVHALCLRDALLPPEWVHEARSDSERTIWGIDANSPLGAPAKLTAPPVCEIHNVFFEADFLDTI